ncbi:MAG: hypothetical protein VW405_10420 [Rhodospirillaceae bacterium]
MPEFLAAVRAAAEVDRWLGVKPRPPTTDDLLAILVDYFKRELIRQKMSLADLPDGIKPYLSRELLETAAYEPGHTSADAEADLADVPSNAWLSTPDWTEITE